ncbi:MAG: hypothetical protein IJ836_07740, partial [Spirochaetales bacterium]|nr:hypothetical protein [Spirochaetales bacterium]
MKYINKETCELNKTYDKRIKKIIFHVITNLESFCFGAKWTKIRMSSAREDDDILALTDAGAGDRVIPFSEDIRYLQQKNTIAGHRI